MRSKRRRIDPGGLLRGRANVIHAVITDDTFPAWNHTTLPLTADGTVRFVRSEYEHTGRAFRNAILFHVREGVKERNVKIRTVLYVRVRMRKEERTLAFDNEENCPHRRLIRRAGIVLIFTRI